MNRRDALKLLATAGILPLLLPNSVKGMGQFLQTEGTLKASDFGKFTWGVATAAAQIEGAWDTDGRGASIWDTYAFNDKIKDHSTPEVSCNFYNHYNSDLHLVKHLGFGALRFSLSWSRIFPEGKGVINTKGVDFYNRVIDACLELGIDPWVTLYHWDLPQALEDHGGWVNRDVIGWFSDYTEKCAQLFGDRVKRWIVLNEPMGFTSLGYGIGYHAPGRIGVNKFMAAAHHATLCQAEGGRILRSVCPDASIGTAFSCSPVDPHHASERDKKAARRLDALMNRMFIEPALGLGYPIKDLPLLSRIEKYMHSGDDAKMEFDFDFIGLQNYFRIVTDFSLFTPYLWAGQVEASKRGGEVTEMDWEVYPDGLYRILKQFAAYGLKELVVTENGAAFKDVLNNGAVNDAQRTRFFQNYLAAMLKAKNEGVNVTGYFVWTLLDNFEWTEGYRPKFGLVHVDFQTQQRVIKDSGKWFAQFLRE
jgi:beta-glucosidase